MPDDKYLSRASSSLSTRHCSDIQEYISATECCDYANQMVGPPSMDDSPWAKRWRAEDKKREYFGDEGGVFRFDR